jgi:predicted membrane channel-forming protein YqfA (hemolysin III family)
MYNKLNDLRFVIGLFFSVVSLILIFSVLLSSTTTKLNIYTGVGFFVFGMLMMFLRKRHSSENK